MEVEPNENIIMSRKPIKSNLPNYKLSYTYKYDNNSNIIENL